MAHGKGSFYCHTDITESTERFNGKQIILSPAEIAEMAEIFIVTARLCRFHQAKRLKDCYADDTDIFVTQNSRKPQK